LKRVLNLGLDLVVGLVGRQPGMVPT
jgi:hypothetical protein